LQFDQHHHQIVHKYKTIAEKTEELAGIRKRRKNDSLGLLTDWLFLFFSSSFTHIFGPPKNTTQTIHTYSNREEQCFFLLLAINQ